MDSSGVWTGSKAAAVTNLGIARMTRPEAYPAPGEWMVSSPMGARPTQVPTSKVQREEGAVKWNSVRVPCAAGERIGLLHLAPVVTSHGMSACPPPGDVVTEAYCHPNCVPSAARVLTSVCPQTPVTQVFCQRGLSASRISRRVRAYPRCHSGVPHTSVSEFPIFPVLLLSTLPENSSASPARGSTVALIVTFLFGPSRSWNMHE
mmetsp:Transcript_3519/g.8372  ORF Transcript_3519/g.8372 Transcript_3519/m.8372 type:complete len:205 (-) Transcript_3519:686-1300(-)